MKFSIGYQLPGPRDSLPAIVRDHREHIGEVYFALPGAASGRSPVAVAPDGQVHPDADAVMREELRELAGLGIKLVLLFNAACYGGRALSTALADEASAAVASLVEDTGLDAVTTTSPFLARVLKERFPTLDMRASVNLRIGTVKAMSYVADVFDSFTMQREQNRDLGRIAALKAWCDARGKGLHLLANSGCLAWCPHQTYHDNLVAHEVELRATENLPQRWPIPCWGHLADREHWVSFLQNTWVRPEDLDHYEPWFEVVKLATRMHQNPRKVIAAYARRRYHGNLLDLMEPGYGPLFGAHVLDNSRFPADWFERTTACAKTCDSCGYCAEVLDQVLVNVATWGPGAREVS